jgi:hypothetical protein
MALSRAPAAREGGGEASVGVVRAGLLSREIDVPGCRRCAVRRKATPTGGAIASRRGTPRGRRTWARTKLSMLENREILRSPVLVDDAPSWMARGVVCRRVAGREGNAEAVSPR